MATQRTWADKEKDKGRPGKVTKLGSEDGNYGYTRELGSGSELYEEVIVRGRVDTVTKAFQGCNSVDTLGTSLSVSPIMFGVLRHA